MVDWTSPVLGRVRRPGLVLRGGSWINNPNNAAAVNRNNNNPNNRNNNNGFRVVLGVASIFFRPFSGRVAPITCAALRPACPPQQYRFRQCALTAYRRRTEAKEKNSAGFVWSARTGDGPGAPPASGIYRSRDVCAGVPPPLYLPRVWRNQPPSKRPTSATILLTCSY